MPEDLDPMSENAAVAEPEDGEAPALEAAAATNEAALADGDGTEP